MGEQDGSGDGQDGRGGDGGAVMPLDVLLSRMRERWDAGDREGAERLAKLAAPYVRRAPAAGTPVLLSKMSDAAIEAAEARREVLTYTAAEIQELDDLEALREMRDRPTPAWTEDG